MIDPRKEKFLNDLKEVYPALKVHYVNIPSKNVWPGDKTLIDLTPEDYEKVNLRRIRSNEIVLDLEDAKRLPEIKEELKNRNWAYQIWHTGSRGYHIILFFDELPNYDIDTRSAIRKKIIREFECDESKSSERTWLALEWANHMKMDEKMNAIKEFREQVDGVNSIPEDVIRYAKEIQELKKEQILVDDEDFKDALNDPYLLWAQNPDNKILAGSRNNVLFKNLAILLVRGGVKYDDIKKLAQIIVNNCPGKRLSEFMGWVDKAMLGEIKEFNKYELLQWAGQNGYPMLYDDLFTEQDGRLGLYTLKQLWEIIWENRPIVAQPVWRNLCFYNMLGTILQEREKDMRVHVIFTSQTSSGKDEGVDLTYDVIKEFNLNAVLPGTITDKTLIGSVNQTAIDMNTKYGLNKAGDVYQRGNSFFEYKAPVEYGVLKTADWMAVPESEFIFKPGAYNRDLNSILRQAMDKKRRIQKGVSGHMIDFYTNTSFLITTYPIPDIMSKITHNGIFQRCLYYSKDITEEDREAIDARIRQQKFNPVVTTNYDEKEWMRIFIERMKTVKQWYDDNKNEIIPYVGMDRDIASAILKYKQQFMAMDWSDRSLLDAAITRGYNTLEKLIKLNAIYKMSNKITKADVVEAMDLFLSCLDSLKNLLLYEAPLPKKITGLKLILDKGKMSSTMIHQELEKKMNLKSSATRNELLKVATAKGEIMLIKEGKYRFYKLPSFDETDEIVDKESQNIVYTPE